MNTFQVITSLELTFSGIEYLGNNPHYFSALDLQILPELYAGELHWMADGSLLIENTEFEKIEETHDLYRFALYCHCWLTYTQTHHLPIFLYDQNTSTDPLGINGNLQESLYFFIQKNGQWLFSSPLIHNFFSKESTVKKVAIPNPLFRQALKNYISRLNSSLLQLTTKPPYTIEQYAVAFSLHDMFANHVAIMNIADLQQQFGGKNENI